MTTRFEVGKKYEGTYIGYGNQKATVEVVHITAKFIVIRGDVEGKFKFLSGIGHECFRTVPKGRYGGWFFTSDEVVE